MARVWSSHGRDVRDAVCRLDLDIGSADEEPQDPTAATTLVAVAPARAARPPPGLQELARLYEARTGQAAPVARRPEAPADRADWRDDRPTRDARPTGRDARPADTDARYTDWDAGPTVVMDDRVESSGTYDWLSERPTAVDLQRLETTPGYDDLPIELPVEEAPAWEAPAWETETDMLLPPALQQTLPRIPRFDRSLDYDPQGGSASPWPPRSDPQGGSAHPWPPRADPPTGPARFDPAPLGPVSDEPTWSLEPPEADRAEPRRARGRGRGVWLQLAAVVGLGFVTLFVFVAGAVAIAAVALR